MLPFSNFTKHELLPHSTRVRVWTLSFQVCSKVTIQLCFAHSCVCSGWLPAALPEPLSCLLHPALSLWRPTPMDHIKGSPLWFSSGLGRWGVGGIIWRSKRIKKVRNQPLCSPLATLSRVDPASLHKKQRSPPHRGEDCIHSLGLL